MGSKVEIDAIATLILPQLWAMSMGPLLNATQFAKFMSAVKKLGARVEEEHSRHLAELRRLEESTVSASRASASVLGENGEVDFEALVRGNGVVNGKTQIAPDPFFGDDGSPGPSQVCPWLARLFPTGDFAYSRHDSSSYLWAEHRCLHQYLRHHQLLLQT